MEGFEDMVVNDIIILATGHWDRDLIEEVFTVADAKAILRTPISPAGSVDRLI